MVRFLIIGAVVGAAFTLYGLIDAAMSEPARARGVSKPVWVVIVVLLPVIGAALWFTLGKERGPLPAPATAPDDDPRFTGTRISSIELDEQMRDLEARLRQLDEEVYPHESTEGPGAGGGELRETSDRSGEEPGSQGGREPGASPNAEPGAEPEERSGDARGDVPGDAPDETPDETPDDVAGAKPNEQ